MMRALPLLFLVVAGCRLTPDLEGNGYIECSSDDVCVTLGRVCESGYCTPPTWWKNEYGSRRQITFTNTSEFDLPKGFTLALPVGGEPRPLKPADVQPGTRFVILDRQARAQVELPVALDFYVEGSAPYDVVFKLPVDVKAGQTWSDLWMYSDGTGVASREDSAKAVYFIDDTFSADALDDMVWKVAGPVTPDGEAVNIARNGYLWSTAGLPSMPGIMLTARFTVSDADMCDGLTMGLIDNAAQGTDVPYVTLFADGTGDLHVEALTSETAMIEPAQLNGVPLKTSSQRADLVISGNAVNAQLNGQSIAAFTTRNAINSTLRTHFFVEASSCVLTLEKVRVRTAVLPAPTISIGPKVKKPT